MTRSARVTLWAVGALLLLMIGATWLMLSAIEGRIDAPCLAKAEPARKDTSSTRGPRP